MKLLTFVLATAVGHWCRLVYALPQPQEDYGYETPSLGQMESQYKQYIKDTLAARDPGAKCNSNNVEIRKEWGSMSKEERIGYTNAVRCLYHKSPPLTSTAISPGVRNRLDDFVSDHIIQGYNIHGNGFLFAWHRHFVWLYHQALRNECGYTGPTPYWDWTRHSDDPRKSPVFDGSETSMGGNGEAIPHGPTAISAFGINATLPPGTGGGCVKDGPFTDLVVNLGVSLIVLPLDGSAPAPPPTTNPLDYNPRCLVRDINLDWAKQVRRPDVEYLLSCPDMFCLMQRADGWEPVPTEGSAAEAGRRRHRQAGRPQVHGAGHLAIGGLQNDPFASPGDPAFYLHHAQMDRLWAIWQAQDPATRNAQVGGTRTPFNVPPSDQVTLDDHLVFDATGPSVRLGDVLSAIDGEYCYMYE